MSAEKQIVDYWLNKKGYYTIGNLKIANKDVGIVAISYEKSGLLEISHLQVNVSITGSISERTNLKKAVEDTIKNEFDSKEIKKLINENIKFLIDDRVELKLNRVLVTGSLPKSRKTEIVKAFKKNNINIIEFEDILSDVFQSLDRQYYRHDVVRTLQLMKFLLMSNPELLADLLSKEGDILNINTRKIFLKNILKKEAIKKHFKTADPGELAELIAQSDLRRPEELAELVENKLLTSRTRKPFLQALLEKERIRKLVPKEEEKPKMDKSLGEFFK